MSQSVCYRPIREDEIPFCRTVLNSEYPWVAEPDWKGIWVREESGRISAFVGFQRPVIVEPMWAEDGSSAIDMMNWIDGALSITGQYEFFVADENKKFQKIAEGHFGFEGKAEVPGKHYFVTRNKAANKPEEK
jgi:hypothetical protein